MSSYMSDITDRIDKASGYPELEHSTSRKRDTSTLDLTDFLNLMVVQLQNQSIDNTTDTSDMLNQMVQMQMITALTNMTDASIMSYANSLVGKEVTIGDRSSGELVEKVVTITGTGMMDGEHVLFVGDDVYHLNSVMAVGRLPKKPEETEGGDKPAEGGDKPVEGTDKPAGGGDKPVEGTDQPAGGGDTSTGDGDKPVEGGDDFTDGTGKPIEGGDKPVEGTDEPVEDGDKRSEQDGADPVSGTEQA